MIKKQGCLFLLLFSSFALTGCLSSLWTGASILYDRHNLYKKISDYQLLADAQHALFVDRLLKQPGCTLDLAVFNGDILLTGHVPTRQLRELASERLNTVNQARKIYKHIAILSNIITPFADVWITAKIRAQIFADASIDPNQFKIITTDDVVYIMGDVTIEQANKVINIARNTENVKRVVTLMKYYKLEERPAH